MAEVKRIDPREFQELGFLQEVNRRFLHPHGLALEIAIDDETGEATFGGVWDYRDDPEGIVFAGDLPGPDAREKAEQVEAERRRHFEVRCDLFGVPADIRQAVAEADVQPLDWLPPSSDSA